MKIKKEKFNELSQLDRIEYLNKKSIINIDVSLFGILSTILLFLGIFFTNSPDHIFEVLYFFFWGYIGLFLAIFYSKKENKKLKEEYFKVEAKTKKK